MESTADFSIENGVLKGYSGPGGNVTIPSGVKTIGDMAFFKCIGLESVVIPEGVTIIGTRSFERCYNLKSVTIPAGLTKICNGAFAECKCLESVTIPEGALGIGFRAFKMCFSLERLTIPASVTFIGAEAFDSCFRLSGIICHSPYAVSYINRQYGRYPVYLAGPLSDLPEEERDGAARGFFCARQKGIREIDRWEEAYLDHIRDHIGAFVDDAKESRFVFMFLLREELLDREGTERLLDCFHEAGNNEAKAVLLQYRQRKFGEDGPGDLSL